MDGFGAPDPLRSSSARLGVSTPWQAGRTGPSVRPVGKVLLPFLLTQIATRKHASILNPHTDTARPQSHRSVGAGRGDCLAVGAERHVVEGAGVAGHGLAHRLA